MVNTRQTPGVEIWGPGKLEEILKSNRGAGGKLDSSNPPASSLSPLRGPNGAPPRTPSPRQEPQDSPLAGIVTPSPPETPFQGNAINLVQEDNVIDGESDSNYEPTNPSSSTSSSS